MFITLLRSLIVFSLFYSNISSAAERLIALTIDDLPFVGESKNFHLNLIINTLKDKQVPATGFIIAKEVNAETLPTLYKFREAGLSLANHSYSHININDASTEQYITQQIDASDKILSPLLSLPKYYRFPYMNMGNGDKRMRVLNQLQNKNYHIAPITIDSKDFIFNQLLLTVAEKDRRNFMSVLTPCYINFIWAQTLKVQEANRLAKQDGKAEILLIHANLLNAYALSELIDFYRQNGYTFISLSRALNIAETIKPNPAQMTAAENPFN